MTNDKIASHNDAPRSDDAEARHARGLAILRQIGRPAYDGPIGRLARVSPDMARFTVDYPYGDVLSRPGLDLRLRQLCNVGSLIAQGSVQPQLRFHMEGLLNVGGSVQDLVEVMFIATAILGFPAAINTIGIVRQILADRSIAFSPMLPEPAAGSSRYARGLRAFGELMQGPPSDYLASFEAISPELARWSIEFAFGDVLARGGLENKAKHLVIATMLATVGNRQDALRLHLESALKVGATRDEIIEALIQVSVYAGFPAALNAFGVAAQAFEERDELPAVASAVPGPKPSTENDTRRKERGLAALAATSGGSGEAVVRSFEDVAPEIGQMIVEYSYGDIFCRPGLDPKTRELTACAALAGRATQTTETPLRVHINAALNVGASREEIVETLLNMVAYFGLPAVQGAMRIAGEEFQKRGLRP